MRLPRSVVDPLWTYCVPGFSGNHGLSTLVERSKVLRSKSSNSFSGVSVFPGLSVFCALATPPDRPRQVRATRIAKTGDAIANALRRNVGPCDFMMFPPSSSYGRVVFVGPPPPPRRAPAATRQRGQYPPPPEQQMNIGHSTGARPGGLPPGSGNGLRRPLLP